MIATTSATMSCPLKSAGCSITITPIPLIPPLLIEDLRSLKAGHTVHCPVYDYSIHNRTDRTEEVHPTKVIIVEGILIFADEELASEMDIKIFVDTDADERILRRILRDVRERGRTLESVVEQYLTTVKPMHEQYVEPSKRRADIIMLQGGPILSRWICSSSASAAHRPGDISAKRKRASHQRDALSMFSVYRFH